MKPLILVDTSVFIDFFRSVQVHELESLILSQRVILSSLVRLELLQGVRKNEMSRLAYFLEGLSLATPTLTTFNYAENLLTQVKSKGLTLGIVDLLLAAQAVELNCPLYSEDKVFIQITRNTSLRLYTT